MRAEMVDIPKGLLLAGMLAFQPLAALADTEVTAVDYLPLNEAESLVRGQLSPQGSVAAMPSRRLLIIDDDQPHIRKALALLKKLDKPLARFRASVDIITAGHEQMRELGLRGQAALKGGWVRGSLASTARRMADRRHYQLLLSAGQPSHIEAGQVYILPETRAWLRGYGITSSATMVPVTGGFDIIARPAGKGMVHLSIRPWLARLQQNGLSGRHELLLGLGSAGNPATPPASPADAPLRLNAQPQLATHGQRIEVTGAATDITVPVNQEIVLAATGGEAREMGRALLAGRSRTGRQNLWIRLRLQPF